MNIFVLDSDPTQAAKYHCDKHVVKMIVEYAQLLSTTHRLLDGKPERFEWTADNGKHKHKTFRLFDGESVKLVNRIRRGEEICRPEIIGAKAYGATHTNHPCNVWARASDSNYNWLFSLFSACLQEYTNRYSKIHKTSSLCDFLRSAPKNIAQRELTPFALAMPTEYQEQDAVNSYRAFYRGAKSRFAVWKCGNVPEWY